MAWLEDRELLPDVAAAAKAEAAHHLGREVADDVAEEIGRHHHAVVFRVLQHPHGDGVHVGVVHLDTGVLTSDAFAGFQEHALGGADDVRLVNDGHLRIPEFFRVVKGSPDDAVAAFLGVDLASDGVLVAGDVGEMREGLAEL